MDSHEGAIAVHRQLDPDPEAVKPAAQAPLELQGVVSAVNTYFDSGHEHAAGSPMHDGAQGSKFSSNGHVV